MAIPVPPHCDRVSWLRSKFFKINPFARRLPTHTTQEFIIQGILVSMAHHTKLTLIDPGLLQRLQKDIDKETEFKRVIVSYMTIFLKTRNSATCWTRMIARCALPCLISPTSWLTPVVTINASNWSQESCTIDDNAEFAVPPPENSFVDYLTEIKQFADQQPYYKYNGMWTRHMENMSYAVVFSHWTWTCATSEARTGKAEPQLLSYQEVAKKLGGIHRFDSISR